MSFASVKLAGTGSYVPQRRLTNEELSKLVDTNDQWIVQRTGIRERRIAAEGETTASMAVAASKAALADAKMEAGDLDLIVCATITPEMQLPSTACFVAKELGLNRAPAFDVTAACSGFLYALETGANFIKGGNYRNVLVLGAETLSRVTDYTDRGSCIIFGDGAGAAILRGEQAGDSGLLYSSLYADGNGWELLYCLPGSRHPITPQLLEQRGQYMKIRGREVYKFAVQRFEELIRDGMEKCGLTVEQIDLIVPHQVNQRIIDSAIAKLGIGPEKVFVNIDRYGNTSAASIPIALDEARRQGKLQAGQVAMMVAFGAGLTWANAVIRL